MEENGKSPREIVAIIKAAMDRGEELDKFQAQHAYHLLTQVMQTTLPFKDLQTVFQWVKSQYMKNL